MSAPAPKAVSVKQIQRLDNVAIRQIGFPSLSLMENAGCEVARVVAASLKKIKRPAVAVFCGTGNNAGDGFVVARHLINAGVITRVFLVGSASKLKNDALVNYRILMKSGYKVIPIKGFNSSARKAACQSDILVDALFGVGLSRNVEGAFKSVIEGINALKKKVIAVDVPSGLDADSGKVLGTCIRAAKTVTFSFAKKGFRKGQGPCMTGKVLVVDIGIPNSVARRVIQ